MKKMLSRGAFVAAVACSLAAGAPTVALAAQAQVAISPITGWEYGLNRPITSVDALTSVAGWGICVNARVVGGGFVGESYCTNGGRGSYTQHPYCGCANRQGAARSQGNPSAAYGSSNEYW